MVNPNFIFEQIFEMHGKNKLKLLDKRARTGQQLNIKDIHTLPDYIQGALVSSGTLSRLYNHYTEYFNMEHDTKYFLRQFHAFLNLKYNIDQGHDA